MEGEKSNNATNTKDSVWREKRETIPFVFFTKEEEEIGKTSSDQMRRCCMRISLSTSFNYDR